MSEISKNNNRVLLRVDARRRSGELWRPGPMRGPRGVRDLPCLPAGLVISLEPQLDQDRKQERKERKEKKERKEEYEKSNVSAR